MDCLLSIGKLQKNYGATVALRSVDLELLRGEVHAILGENGAGKSTLVKILSGAVRPNGGTLTLGGEAYHPTSVMAARRAGIATAFQELSVLPNLTVAQNLLLPRISRRLLPTPRRRVLERAQQILRRFGVQDIDPRALVQDLSLAEKQRLEITRALSHEPKLLILDEPTAALPDTSWLFQQVRAATAKGVAVLYISHRLAEVRQLCQRATVLRNGESIGTVPLAQVGDDEIFRMMVGRSRDTRFPARTARTADRPILLQGKGLEGGRLRGLDFTLARGEILGVAALEGQGQSDFFRALGGLGRLKAGEIRLADRPLVPSSPRRVLLAEGGIAFVPEERKVEGIFGGLRSAANISLPALAKVARAGFINHRLDVAAIGEAAKAVALDKRYFGFRTNELSGGNQQKVVLARALLSGAECLVLFDPTRGVDVGTKQAIYQLIRAFAERGGGVLIYSSELTELVHLADRCLVIYGGRVVADLPSEELSEESLLSAAHGHVAARPAVRAVS